MKIKKSEIRLQFLNKLREIFSSDDLIQKASSEREFESDGERWKNSRENYGTLHLADDLAKRVNAVVMSACVYLFEIYGTQELVENTEQYRLFTECLEQLRMEELPLLIPNNTFISEDDAGFNDAVIELIDSRCEVLSEFEFCDDDTVIDSDAVSFDMVGGEKVKFYKMDGEPNHNRDLFFNTAATLAAVGVGAAVVAATVVTAAVAASKSNR